MYAHKETIIRTIILVITWVNMVLANYGLETIPVLSDNAVAIGLAAIATIAAWFKNNYITLKKGKAQHEVLKARGLTKE